MMLHVSGEKTIRYWVALSVFAIALVMMGYAVPRENFALQLLLFSFAFVAYWKLYQFFRNGHFGVLEGVMTALGLRMLLLFSIPALSDDFYRFIFDGQLLKSGINPYAFLPEDAFQQLQIPSSVYWEELLTGMNSLRYYSVYPPLHQLFFFFSALAGSSILGNILILRLVILVFESLNILLIYSILKLWGLPISRIWLYAFNPLVILELTGNLHFEALVITGLLGMLYGLSKGKEVSSTFAWAWAAGIKLSPLMLGPFLMKVWGKSKVFHFLFWSAVWMGIFLLPLFAAGNFSGFWQSFRLYQSNFEFNASVWYLIRWISAFWMDYNPLVYVGPFLSLFALVGIFAISFFHKIKEPKHVASAVVWIYLVYLFLQTVVHPWYILPAFAVGVLVGNRVFLVWTGMVFLSYSAYSVTPVSENWMLILLEYAVLIAVVILELRITIGLAKRSSDF